MKMKPSKVISVKKSNWILYGKINALVKATCEKQFRHLLSQRFKRKKAGPVAMPGDPDT